MAETTEGGTTRLGALVSFAVSCAEMLGLGIAAWVSNPVDLRGTALPASAGDRKRSMWGLCGHDCPGPGMPDSAAPRPGVSAGLWPWRGPRPSHAGPKPQSGDPGGSHGRQSGDAHIRRPRSRLSSSRAPRLSRSLRSRRTRSASPNLDPVSTRMNVAPARERSRPALSRPGRSPVRRCSAERLACGTGGGGRAS